MEDESFVKKGPITGTDPIIWRCDYRVFIKLYNYGNEIVHLLQRSYTDPVKWYTETPLQPPFVIIIETQTGMTGEFIVDTPPICSGILPHVTRPETKFYSYLIWETKEGDGKLIALNVDLGFHLAYSFFYRE